MTNDNKCSAKSADNQSEARISVAYNKDCHLSLMTSFVKRGPVVSSFFRNLTGSYFQVHGHGCFPDCSYFLFL